MQAGWGQGVSKGGGKAGQTGFQGQCNWCGDWGHRLSECSALTAFNRARDAAKGKGAGGKGGKGGYGAKGGKGGKGVYGLEASGAWDATWDASQSGVGASSFWGAPGGYAYPQPPWDQPPSQASAEWQLAGGPGSVDGGLRAVFLAPAEPPAASMAEAPPLGGSRFRVLEPADVEDQAEFPPLQRPELQRPEPPRPTPQERARPRQRRSARRVRFVPLADTVGAGACSCGIEHPLCETLPPCRRRSPTSHRRCGHWPFRAPRCGSPPLQSRGRLRIGVRRPST